MLDFSENDVVPRKPPAASVQAFRLALMDWYAASRRTLPWRETRDPYLIWVSETMLVQTQVATVVDYFHRFIHAFPDVSALAAADLQEVLKLWEGLGYYSRARNFHKAAKIVVGRHGGRVPEDGETFLALPGVGDYIACAVQSIAFSRPAAVVDGNVKRVLARMFTNPAPVNGSSAHKIFKAIAGDLLCRDDPGTYNQAVMELGALICRPANPLCSDCPVSSWCLAFSGGRVRDFPVKIQKPPTPHFHQTIGVVVKNSRLLIVLRPETGLLGGLWEFPGGTTMKDESAETACIRNIRETTGLHARIRCFLARVHHAYTHFKITADVFVCDWEAGRVRLKGPADFRWARMNELAAHPFPKSNHKFMDILLKELSI